MNDEIHIASLIVHTKSDHMPEILQRARSLTAAECHISPEESKFIVVFEAGSDAELYNTMNEISSWQGVLSAQLCYHHCETNAALQEEIDYETHAT